MLSHTDPIYFELGTFLFQFIDIQIKKYCKLTEIGIGPDAGMNADLVRGEVGELLQLAQEFIDDLEKEALDKEKIQQLCSHLNFYLTLEDHRATAGELLDSNNIHNTVYDRLQKQIAELNQFARRFDLQPFSPRAKSPLQEQCQFDSYAIADYILACALVLTKNPDASLPKGLVDYPPETMQHAEGIMRKNAKAGRYAQRRLAHELERGHRYFQNYLSQSTLKKSSTSLDKATATQAAQAHRVDFDDLLKRFDAIAPTTLKTSGIQWYEIPFLRKTKPNRPIPQFKFTESDAKKSSQICSSTFFKGAVCVAIGVSAVALTRYAMACRSG